MEEKDEGKEKMREGRREGKEEGGRRKNKKWGGDKKTEGRQLKTVLRKIGTALSLKFFCREKGNKSEANLPSYNKSISIFVYS